MSSEIFDQEDGVDTANTVADIIRFEALIGATLRQRDQELSLPTTYSTTNQVDEVRHGVFRRNPLLWIGVPVAGLTIAVVGAATGNDLIKYTGGLIVGIPVWVEIYKIARVKD